MVMGRAWSVAVVGVEGHLVQVEADIGSTLPGFSLVGLPDTALSESRDRVRAAITNSCNAWPTRKLTVGLSPATLPKAGSHFDLGIACAILAAVGAVPRESLEGVVLLGELGLDGRLRPVRGTLPAVLAAVDQGIRRFVVPEPNLAEARLVEGIACLGMRSLRQVIAELCGAQVPDEPELEEASTTRDDSGSMSRGGHASDLDLAEVLGQAEARAALEIAAAGGHHVFLSGPPGAGKTMLAERLPGLLPPLDPVEALEVTAIHSVAGVLPADTPLIRHPPFCDPHHSASRAAIIGGGARVATPGAVSLAHRGVLFLDEAPEVAPAVLEALRQPLEDGEIVIARAAGAARFPARFQLVLAANPCPCGRGFGKGLYCTCTPQAKLRYQHRLSGPIRDRVDITQHVEPVSRADLRADRAHIESTEVIAERVAQARQRQRVRYAEHPWNLNASVPGSVLRRDWPPDRAAMALVEEQLSTGALSARGADRVLRLAWSLADLQGAQLPGRDQILHALTLRMGHQPRQSASTTDTADRSARRATG